LWGRSLASTAQAQCGLNSRLSAFKAHTVDHHRRLPLDMLVAQHAGALACL